MKVLHVLLVLNEFVYLLVNLFLLFKLGVGYVLSPFFEELNQLLVVESQRDICYLHI